jgi:hypothetical protein
VPALVVAVQPALQHALGVGEGGDQLGEVLVELRVGLLLSRIVGSFLLCLTWEDLRGGGGRHLGSGLVSSRLSRGNRQRWQ